jgi:hypothetical protein
MSGGGTALASVESPTRLSYAPFSSSAERGMLAERFASDYTPGPGEYNTSTVPHPGKPVGPTHSTSFVSGVPRFTRDGPSGVPGPGQLTSIGCNIGTGADMSACH